MDFKLICSCFILILFLAACEKEAGEFGMLYIPAGEFIIGSNKIDTERFAKEFGDPKGVYYEDEKPLREMGLKAYYIDKYEVTMRQYKVFLDWNRYPAPNAWNSGNYPEGQDDYPVAFISWFNANDYCAWSLKRLPTEEEWEKAARGPQGNVYPWGNDYDESKANLNDSKQAKKVGSYETDKSYYGVYDMGGNMMEWVDSWYKPYPGNKHEHKDFGETYRVLRGGSFIGGHYMMNKMRTRASFRSYFNPSGFAIDSGFRCAKDAEE